MRLPRRGYVINISELRTFREYVGTLIRTGRHWLARGLLFFNQGRASELQLEATNTESVESLIY